MAALVQLGKDLKEKREAVRKLWDEHPDRDFDSEQVAFLRDANSWLEAKQKEYDEREAVEQATQVQLKADDLLRRSQAGVVHAGDVEIKDSVDARAFYAWQRMMSDPAGLKEDGVPLAKRVTESVDYKTARERRSWSHAVIDVPDVDVKTTMTTTTGYPPFVMRQDFFIPFPVRRVMVPDLIPQDTTDQSAIQYVEETTFTNNAAFTAEASALPESADAFTVRTRPIELVGDTLPVTLQQLEDVPQIQAIINNRLGFHLQLAEETQLLNGNGTSPQLDGFYNKSGVQVQAQANDSLPDAAFKAVTLIEANAFTDPTAFIFHPLDWQGVQLLQTSFGQYIWGSPADKGPRTLWGYPVVSTTAATQGTVLTGDFTTFAHIWRRMGIRLDVTDSHASQFVNVMYMLRAIERMCLTIYRPSAFATITGVH